MRTVPFALAVALTALAGISAAQKIEATVNGTPVYFADVQPMMMNQRVMVPLRGVFEQMGAGIDWNEARQQVTAKTDDRTVILTIGSQFATVNGKQVALDSPATKYRDRTMVPLRFIGEALGAKVAWQEPNLVAITTTDIAQEQDADVGNRMTIEANTVIPLKLNGHLTSDGSQVGDTFTAALDTKGDADYQGLPSGTMVEGHVSIVRAKDGKTPGVLGLEYDRIVLPGGKAYAVDASLVGLDDKSVTDENGRLVAKDTKKNKDTLKYVGYGAGGGTLVAILTRGNVLTNALIGGALGWIFSELQKNPSQANNVNLESGAPMGMKLDQRLIFTGIIKSQ